MDFMGTAYIVAFYYTNVISFLFNCFVYIYVMFESRNSFKKIIVRVTCFGFLCDIIAIILMFLIVGTLEIFIKPTLGFFNWYGSFLYSLVVKIPMNIVEVLILSVAILLSRIINYKLNKRYTFSKLDIEEEKKKKLALAIAIFTAPYMFFFTITI